MNCSLAVCFLEKCHSHSAVLTDMLQQLGLPNYFLEKTLKQVSDYDYLLLVDTTSIAIAKTGKGAPAPVTVNFVNGAAAHRRKFGGGKSQDIAKAVGIHKKSGLRVLDATAGLGRDAFVLASLGCQVHMFERVPFVRVLLQSGLEQAANDEETHPIISKMALAGTTLSEYQARGGEKADVVYLDPMYPHADKSAAVKKEMAFFRDLIGHDDDADQLLPLALSLANYRVVVKRPKSAPYLNNQKPTYQLLGKAGRFDIYVLKSLELE
ncbi:16S rRNA methyltransferase [Marinomonas agarivorans]|nr:16S rRNA methyltransferase [Marinomonas agarivorans]